jgi:hypothetical protein
VPSLRLDNGFNRRLTSQSTTGRGEQVLHQVGARAVLRPGYLALWGTAREVVPGSRLRHLPAALAAAGSTAAAGHFLPEQDASELGESNDCGRGAQAEPRPILVEPECDRAGTRAGDKPGPEPPALDRQCLYEFTIASIAAATSPARNGIPRTRLKPVASTRNSARTSFCSWPRLISGTSTLS